jgi:hypothetical protein
MKYNFHFEIADKIISETYPKWDEMHIANYGILRGTIAREFKQLFNEYKILKEQNKQMLEALIYVHKRYENVVFTKGFQPPITNILHPEVEDNLYYEKVTSLIESITQKKMDIKYTIEKSNLNIRSIDELEKTEW